jgi:hypothetical protein
VRDAVRAALESIASRFSDDAPSVDEAMLQSRYSALEVWPADAELGLYVLAWALGPGFSSRGFREAVNTLVPDFARAASAMEAGNDPSLITLIGIARRALCNATVVTTWNLNPEILYWPLDLASCTLK